MKEILEKERTETEGYLRTYEKPGMAHFNKVDAIANRWKSLGVFQIPEELSERAKAASEERTEVIHLLDIEACPNLDRLIESDVGVWYQGIVHGAVAQRRITMQEYEEYEARRKEIQGSDHPLGARWRQLHEEAKAIHRDYIAHLQSLLKAQA